MADSDAAAAAPAKRSPSPAPPSATHAAGSSSSADAPKQKRQRIDRRGDDSRGQDSNDNSSGAAEGEVRLPKRPVALLFGYCGVGYSGLQINPGVKTIEGDIFDVLCNAGCVSKDNAVNPNKVSLQRSARTDRGVHAAGNLLNMKCILNPPVSPSGEMKPLIAYLNSQLPPLIRIWNIVKVQSSFNARSSCDSRYYQYLLPTYVFLPPKPGSAMWKMYKEWEKEEEEGVGEEEKRRLQQILYHPFWADAYAAYKEKEEKGPAAKEGEGEGEASAATATSAEDPTDVKVDSATTDTAPPPAADTSPFKADTIRKRTYRLSTDPSPYGAELLPRLRTLWSTFLGTRNFHNFTVGKPFKDPSAKRVMKKMEISDPFIVDNTEYVSLTLHGQSFMLHQIRKMVGLIVMLARSPAPGPKLLNASLTTKDKIHVPKAPALGLLLNSPVFVGYNVKVRAHNAQLEKMHKEGKIDETRKADQWREEISYDPFRAEMEEFRMRHIYQTQYETEEREDEFAKWLNYLDSIVGPDFLFLNLKGNIPKECLVGGNAVGGGSSVMKGLGKSERAEKRKERDAAPASGSIGEVAKQGNDEEYKGSDDEDEALPAGAKAADYEG
ncbi:pseudouridine synthase [Jaminaea rosea]|uniref:tRNA pseudouridine synthase 1 n=1 Tax=Jaminaea rosea TaxID=1569628 RepID=A0A316V6P7_9BASI|nr:pseudouridine synthase [Jaminaea rosea]PWN31125.1 pseudouridine synthase [Jaminaea rosea]